MSIMSIIKRLIQAIISLFREPPSDPLAPSGTPGVTAPVSDLDIIGLYTHYSPNDPSECTPYNNVDPNRYPDVWVVGVETAPGVPGKHHIIGLEVDGYQVPQEDVRSINSPEHSRDLRIATIRYPRYDRYRQPGLHKVNVLVGRPTADGRGTEWIRKVPYTIRTVKDDN
jgi:hypothetical protein